MQITKKFLRLCDWVVYLCNRSCHQGIFFERDFSCSSLNDRCHPHFSPFYQRKQKTKKMPARFVIPCKETDQGGFLSLAFLFVSMVGSVIVIHNSLIHNCGEGSIEFREMFVTHSSGFPRRTDNRHSLVGSLWGMHEQII